MVTGCSNAAPPSSTEMSEHIESLTPPTPNARKKIISIQWMSSDFSTESKSASPGDSVGLLIKTSGYIPNEKITTLFEDKNTHDDGGSYTIVRKITGIVDHRGEIRAILKITEPPKQ